MSADRRVTAESRSFTDSVTALRSSRPHQATSSSYIAGVIV